MKTIIKENNYKSPQNINYLNNYTNNNHFTNRNFNENGGNNYNYFEENNHKNNFDIKIIDRNIEKIKNDNIKFQTYIKKCKAKIISKDKEIEGYKEKVKSLLNRINEKNNEIILKDSIIVKLNEEKELNINLSNNIDDNSNIDKKSMQYQLELSFNEIEKYKKENIKLKQIIQNLNKKIDIMRAFINKKGNIITYDRKQDNYVIKSFCLTFDKNNFLYKKEKKKFLIKENNNNDNGDKIISLEFEIKKLNNIIEELKIKIENEKKKT